MWLWILRYIAGAVKLSQGQHWKLSEGKETLGVTELWEWLCKNSPLSFSLHCLWPCVPSGLVCGVNTLLSNALLSRLGVTVTNCLMIGDFYMADWKNNTVFTVDYINSWPWSSLPPISQTCFVYSFLLSPRTLLSHIPFLTCSQVFQNW